MDDSLDIQACVMSGVTKCIEIGEATQPGWVALVARHAP
jgi:hypothetical protein